MIVRTMHSPLWHRVEQIRLRLKPGVVIERQVIRGEVWYIAQDRLAARPLRFSAAVYRLLVRMDGERTLGEVWTEVAEAFGEDAPTQDQMLQAVSQLYRLDILHSDAVVDQHELAERAHRTQQRQIMQRFQNPLFIRIPLFNPDRILAASVHLVRPLFTTASFVIWLGIVAWLAAEVFFHWPELTGNLADRVLAPGNLLFFLVLFPIVKAIHELAHGYAAKVAGVEVPEIGLMFLVLAPAPFVDVSASALLPRKSDRIRISAAGMMAELVVAALAMLIWLNAEPGLIRATAHSVMLVAGASTLLFNANPLMRFDGYYILSDLLEIPNLAARSSGYWLYLIQRYLFGARSAVSPVTGHGEWIWLLLYSPLAVIYRVSIVISIGLFVATHYFFIGVGLALWTVLLSIVWPLIKGLKFVLVSPRLASVRMRAVTVSGAIALFIIVATGVIGLPFGTVVQGVVLIPENARVVAGTAGTVVRLFAGPGGQVVKGDPLIELDDPRARITRKLAAARAAELEYRLTAAEVSSTTELEMMRQRLAFARDELAEADRRLSELTVRSPGDGVFIVPRSTDLEGRYAAKGALLGYVMPAGRRVVRAVVPETEIDTVRILTGKVDVALHGTMAERVSGARISREVPGATRKLPSAALGTAAGGPLAIDPTAKNAETALNAFFEIDVELPDDIRLDRWGERVHVRFDHGPTPLAVQLFRTVRQVFLTRLNV